MTQFTFSLFVGLSSFLLGIAACVGGYLLHQKRERERQLKSKKKQTLAQALRVFFGSDPNDLPVVSRGFSNVDLPNLHLALETYQLENRMLNQISSAMSINLAMAWATRTLDSWAEMRWGPFSTLT